MLKIRSDIILESELLIKQHRFSSCVKQLDHDEITLALIKMIFFFCAVFVNPASLDSKGFLKSVIKAIM